MKLIDLAHQFHNDISLYPGTPKPEIFPLANHKEHGYSVHNFKVTTHTGTHLDVPFHMIANGKNLSQMPLEHFIGKATVIPKPNNPFFTLDYLKNYQLLIKNVDFVLLQTGMEKFWNTPQYLDPFPTLTEEAATWLTKQNLKGIGLDCLSVDPIDSETFPIHKIILGNNLIIIENMKNFDPLVEKIFNLIAFPISIQNSDGGPVRPVAILDD